ncbi:hypothetical protein J8J27_25765, partial [Mycobacterium tuberculosis]|nr:hypothetical protein [Mycobacterium tuberculosis]
FYQANGTPKTVADVYGFLTREADVPTPSTASGPARPSPMAANPLSTIIAAQSAGSQAKAPLGFAVDGDPALAKRSLDTSVAQLSIPGDTSAAATEA